MTNARLPVLFISHGGGPWPYVDALRKLYPDTEYELRRVSARLAARPHAVLMISAHWEANDFSVATAARPPMEYDYSGFPPNTYAVSYPAPGNPSLARHALDLIAGAGLDVTADSHKGFDHGVFVPLGLMYPGADMPIVMVSIKSNCRPAEHLALGRALPPLREEGVLVIGSGLTYHNMSGFNRDSATVVAEAFDGYLKAAVTLEDPHRRDEKLLHWEHAPSARLAHPRAEHLMPLLVAAGAADADQGRVLFAERVMKIPMTSYAFGDIH